MKKMREHEEKEQKNLESRIIDIVFINNQHYFNLDITLFEEASTETLLPAYQANYAYKPISSIFHPPLV